MSNTPPVNPEHYAIVKVLAAAFPHNKVTAETILAYTAFLADLDPVALRRAASWCMANCEFFPTMRALREAIQMSDTEHRAPTGADAWAEVTKRFGSHGSARTVEWSHPLVLRGVDAMGGWRNLCMSEDPGGVLRGQFLKVYGQLEERHNQDERAALAGSGQAWAAIGTLAGRLALPGSKRP